MLELITLGGVFGWAASLLLRPGLLPPHHAVAVGIPGMFVGIYLWSFLGLPVGPSFEGYPLIPPTFGAVIVLSVVVYVQNLREELRVRSRSRGDSLEAHELQPRHGSHR